VSFRTDPSLFRSGLRCVPDTAVELEQQLAVGDRETALTVRTEGTDLDRFEDALAADETVVDVERLNVERDGSRRYRVRVPRERSLYPTWAESGAVLLDATGRAEGWTCQMRFPDRDTLCEFREGCHELGWGFRLVQLTKSSAPEADD
jgi:hypothetical protein